MILLMRTNDTRTIDAAEGGTVEVPDIKLPPSVAWSARYLPGIQSTYFRFKRNGKRTDMLLDGPHEIGGSSYFLATFSTQERPALIRSFFQGQLGVTGAEWLKRALVQYPAVRNRFRPILREYREDGKLRGLFARHAIGNSPTLATDPDETSPTDIPEA